MIRKRTYNFQIDLTWRLISSLSRVDRFDASWSAIEKVEGASLKQLKSIATVRSVAASTRIEGSSMSNEEVDQLLQNLSVDKLTNRDSQEVAGYFNVLDQITIAYDQISISENSIKGLHKLLLQHSQKDQWHLGEYKQHGNNVQAEFADGSSQVIFKTTPAGIETDDAMQGLLTWFEEENEVHPMIKSAIFCYEFVTIHPFQDGNGRLSRLLASLLLLKYNYSWIQYISFEHEIENKKLDYYRVLRECQSQRPHENITQWISFFLETILTIQDQLMKKLEVSGLKSGLSPKEKSLLASIANYPGIQSGMIAQQLNMSLPTVKKLLAKLSNKKLITKHGVGRGTNYTLR